MSNEQFKDQFYLDSVERYNVKYKKPQELGLAHGGSGATESVKK